MNFYLVGRNAAVGHRLPQACGTLPSPLGVLGKEQHCPDGVTCQCKWETGVSGLDSCGKRSGEIQGHFLNLVSKFLLAAFQQSQGWEKSCLGTAASPSVLQLQVLH